MAKICHAHCPDDGGGLGYVVLGAAVAAAGLAVVLWVTAHAVVLALGLAAVAVAEVALQRFLLRHVVVTVRRPAPARPAVQAAPARPSQAISAPRRRAIEAPRRRDAAGGQAVPDAVLVRPRQGHDDVGHAAR